MTLPQPRPGLAGRRLTAVPAQPPAEINPQVLRGILGRFATGITVLTVGGDQPHGMTANAFSSLSLDPPLVLACIGRTAMMHESVHRVGAFGVSVLHGRQERLARWFADSRRPAGAAQFREVDWTPGPVTGSPLLVGGLAWVECALEATHDAGDHTIFIGRVRGLSCSDDNEALLFFGGGYHRLVYEA